MKRTLRNQGSSGNPTAHQIMGALRSRGSSLRRWALGAGYGYTSVHRAVQTWAGRTDRRPHGGQAREIMARLRADLGPELVPDVGQKEAR